MIAAATDSFASNSLPTAHSTRPVPNTLTVIPIAKKIGPKVSKRPRPEAICSAVRFGFFAIISALRRANSASITGCIAFFVRKASTAHTTARKSSAIPNFPSALRAKTEDGA